MQEVDDTLLEQNGYHRPLMMNIDMVVRDANIPKSMIRKSMVSYCSETEIEYIRSVRRLAALDVFGLVLTGSDPKRPVSERMMAMAAACLRNYLSATVLSLSQLLQVAKDGGEPEARVLLIPNFYLTGKTLTTWKAAMLLDLLYDRQMQDRQTVVYADDLEQMTLDYGAPLRQHIDAYFQKVDL